MIPNITKRCHIWNAPTNGPCYHFFMSKIRLPHHKKPSRLLSWRDTVSVLLLIFCAGALFAVHEGNAGATASYNALLSRSIVDRNGDLVMREQNARGAYTREGDIPSRLKELVIMKEDAWFYYHPGVNPWSYVRVTGQFARDDRSGGGSTITQQLAKVLLGNESSRTLRNKSHELLLTVALELGRSKEEILDMYLRTAFLGNQSQGFPEASMRYFGKPLTALDDDELFSLVATLGRPSTRNPWTAQHEGYVTILAKTLGEKWAMPVLFSKKNITEDGSGAFELRSLGAVCKGHTCSSTIDQTITEKLRRAAKQVTDAAEQQGAANAAIVVLTLPERELLAIVGSVDTKSMVSGNQINMAIAPRPIGSTIKPLIYEQAFERGLRPYTLVRDDEYRYDIATGFPLYPKNYDGRYHGEVTLEHALANSLNVPAVKTLEYLGIDEFTRFLTKELHFVPLTDIASYQYGIALGGLEMDLATLVQYLSLFGTHGSLSPIALWMDGGDDASIARVFPSMSRVGSTTAALDPRFVGLVNHILTDRALPVEQFGLNNNLTILGTNVAVKTGTSRDYHDSWTVGWTPDLIVGVWIGNAKNTALQNVSGASGAGKLWQEAMGILLNSQYNKRTSFVYPGMKEFQTDDGSVFGLSGDNVGAIRRALLDDKLIRFPHDGDTFSLEKNSTITLRAARPVTWSINSVPLGTEAVASFHPSVAGEYRIRAKTPEKEETISITILARD